MVGQACRSILLNHVSKKAIPWICNVYKKSKLKKSSLTELITA